MLDTTSEHYAVTDDGRIFTMALISCLTWTLAQENPLRHFRTSCISLVVSMLVVYVLGIPAARAAYTIFGRRPKIARMVFMIVALATVAAMAACN
jgi:hypothetical protein